MMQGIRVGATWYPILKMKWTEGESLVSYVEKNLNSPIVLQRLAGSWCRLLNDLQKAKIAHGDLQHGNVLVIGSELKLVDYDGMYVPALDGDRALENGHRNYQRPERTDVDFGSYLDNFSAWLIYISILALSVKPGLWQALKSGDECLLFRKSDLAAPERSEAFRLLRALPNDDVRDLVERFEDFLWLPLSRIPTIPDDLPGQRQNQRGVPPKGVPDWISDHLASSKHEAVSSPEPLTEENEIGNHSWIVDHVEPVSPVGSFQNRTMVERLLLIGAVAVACGLAALKAPLSLVGTVALYMLNLVIAATAMISVWLVRYFREPIVTAARESAIPLRDANQNVDTERANHESLKRKRHQRREIHAAEIQRTNLAQNKAQADQTAKLAEIDGWLKNLSKQLHDKRRSLAGDEAEEKRRLAETATKLSQRINAVATQQQQELNQLDSGLGQRIRSQEAQLQQVTSTLNSELQRALKEHQDQIVLTHLHRCRITDHSITGIGPELKRRLSEAGFFSAADVVTRSINVPGIGATKRAALQNWATWLDINTIRPREAPKTLPAHMAANIERRYEASIRQLERGLAGDRPQFTAAADQIKKKYAEQKRLLEGELATEETRVRQQSLVIEQRFEAQRNALSGEEGQARQLATKRAEEWTQQFRDHMNGIAAEVERLRNQYASDLDGINNELGASAKRVREMCWRRDQLARMHEAYAHITFRRYCARVFWRA